MFFVQKIDLTRASRIYKLFVVIMILLSSKAAWSDTVSGPELCLSDYQQPYIQAPSERWNGANHFREARRSIIDRNGRLLAHDDGPKTYVLVEPSQVSDLDQTVTALTKDFPELASRVFRWPSSEKKALTSANLREILLLGRPIEIYLGDNLEPETLENLRAIDDSAIHLLFEPQRAYPFGKIAGHVVGQFEPGLTYPDNAGIEAYFSEVLKTSNTPLQLSLDVELQQIVSEELGDVIKEFRAEAAAGVLIDVDTFEILSMVSLPEYDPDAAYCWSDPKPFNLASEIPYELGSVMKVFTMAAALDREAVDFDEAIDVSEPLKFGSYSVRDYGSFEPVMTPKQIIQRSSNIGIAKIGLRLGAKDQKNFMRSLGFMDIASAEISEVASPAYWEEWSDVHTATISHGYGLALSPLHAVNAFGAIVNGGYYLPTTLIKANTKPKKFEWQRVISEQTSQQLRDMLAYNVTSGTGRFAQTDAFQVGGKTGTVNVTDAGGYSEDARIATFLGAFPIDKPRYAMIVLVHSPDPEAQEYTYGYATGGWVAAPAFRKIVERAAPILSFE